MARGSWRFWRWRARPAGGYWLHQGRQHARQDAAAATQRAQAAEAEKTELAQKVEKLETEKTELATAKEELSKDVQAKTGELAAAQGHVRQACKRR